MMKKHTFFLLIGILFFCAFSSYAQKTKINLNVKMGTIKQVTAEIEKKSDFIFVFADDTETLLNRKVNIVSEGQSVESILNKIFANTELRYRMLDKQIVIYREKTVEPSKKTTKEIPEQKKVTITGKVTDSNKEPLIGVSILELGTNNGTITNYNGEYSVTVKSVSSVLKFTYLGYEQQQIEIGNKNSIQVVMKEATKDLDEVVVVGYGTMQKRDVTGAIVSVRSEDIENKTPVNLFDALQGQTAGVQIVRGSGAPGESSSIQIRGTSTFSSAGVAPLYIVDEMPVESIDDINPNDIASMEVLKDAASASIYGSRSANGVVIITTKKGEKSKPKVEVKYNTGIGKLAHKMPQSNRLERLLYDDIRKQYFIDMNMGDALITESDYIREDTLNYFLNVDNDYQDLVYGLAQKHDMSVTVSGAENKLRYYVSNGFLKEKGLVPTTDYTRLNTRVNVDYFFTNKFRTGNRLYVSYAKKNKVNESGLQSNIQRRAPYHSTHYSDGTLVGFTGYVNPLALIYSSIDLEDIFTANVFQYFDYNFSKYLRFRTNFSGSFSLTKQRKFQPSYITDINQNENSGAAYNFLHYNWMNENYFTYSRKWNGHNLNAILGVSYQKWNFDRENIVGRNSTDDYIYTMNSFVSNLNLSSTGTWISEHSLASIYSRVTYDYLGRYLLAANIRRDGSSRFGSGNKWGNFPSASVGWRFSDERFMKFTQRFLDDAKLRVSYGVTGNQSIGDYDHYYSYAPGDVYDGIGGVAPARLGSKELRWEGITQTNLGLDLSFWGSRLVLNVDLYNKVTDGILSNFEVAKELGYSSVRANIGTVTNKGIEFVASGDVIRSDRFTWNASFNIAVNDNRINKLSLGRTYIQNGLWLMSEGGRIGDFIGFKYIDIFPYNESNAFTPDWQQLTPVFENGVFQNAYLLNGSTYSGDVLQKKLPNGTPFRGGDVNWEEHPDSKNGIIDYDDRMYMGNALAEITGGFNSTLTYKNISLYLSFYYSFGNDIYNWAEYFRNSFKNMGSTPTPQVIHNIWRKPGDIALYPRPYDDEFENSRYANSFYVEDGSYIRLQDVKISYNFPDKLINKIKINKMNLYGYISNVLTWTKYQGIDPEFTSYNPIQIGEDRGMYPRKREFGLGLNINF